MNTDLCSKNLIFVGCHPDHSLGKMRIGFNFTAFFCAYVLVFLKIFVEEEVEAVESLSIFVIITAKYVTLVFGRGLIKKILNLTETFWDIISTDPNTEFLMQHLGRVKKFHVFVMTFGVGIYMFKPFFLHTTSIFNCYKPPNVPFLAFYLYECYILIVFASCYVAFNVLICTLITAVAVQFRVLSMCIENIKFADVESDNDFHICVEELKHKIRYHQFLMRFVHELNKLLAMPVALLMICGVMVMCMDMYSLSVTKGSALDHVRVLITSSAMVSEFFAVFGLPSQLLTDESRAISDTIYYECQWYLPKIITLRKDLAMIIMRSQKSACIRAGYYHVVSNQTILFMLKTAYSFYTVLQTMA